jgi:hypothetical protein
MRCAARKRELIEVPRFVDGERGAAKKVSAHLRALEASIDNAIHCNRQSRLLSEWHVLN